MIYRVFDIDKKEWVVDNIYITQDGKLFKMKKNIFKLFNIPFELLQNRYIVHEYIGLNDKLNNKVFIGDYVKAKISEDKEIVGLVIFAPELSGYILLCEDTNEWFSLGNEICEYVEVVGNVFDGCEK